MITEIDGIVAVGHNGAFSSKTIPENVRRFLAFYSDPTERTREIRAKEGSPHFPGSGARSFRLSPSTEDLGVFPVDETHQSIDSSQQVHQRFLDLVLPSEPLDYDDSGDYDMLFEIWRATRDSAAPINDPHQIEAHWSPSLGTRLYGSTSC